MSKHTPRPWVRVADSIKSRTADCVVVRLPAQTDRVGDESPEQIERWDADARLIAAAPELLEAIEAAIASGMVGGDMITSGPVTPTPQGEAAVMLRAALAKAKGEE